MNGTYFSFKFLSAKKFWKLLDITSKLPAKATGSNLCRSNLKTCWFFDWHSQQLLPGPQRLDFEFISYNFSSFNTLVTHAWLLQRLLKKYNRIISYQITTTTVTLTYQNLMGQVMFSKLRTPVNVVGYTIQGTEREKKILPIATYIFTF